MDTSPHHLDFWGFTGGIVMTTIRVLGLGRI